MSKPAENNPFINLSKSGYENFAPLWAQSGKSIIWFSDRYGLQRDDGNRGDPQLDVYETFFTQEALTRFRLSPTEYEILTANEDKAKANKDDNKSREAKDSQTKAETANRPPKLEPITIDLKAIDDRTVRQPMGYGSGI